MYHHFQARLKKHKKYFFFFLQNTRLGPNIADMMNCLQEKKCFTCKKLYKWHKIRIFVFQKVHCYSAGRSWKCFIIRSIFSIHLKLSTSLGKSTSILVFIPRNKNIMQFKNKKPTKNTNMAGWLDQIILKGPFPNYSITLWRHLSLRIWSITT